MSTDLGKQYKNVTYTARGLPNHGDRVGPCQGHEFWDEKSFPWDKLTNSSNGWLKTGMARDQVDMVFRIMVEMNSKIPEATMGYDRRFESLCPS
jgi:hypothetical protein